MKSLSHRLWASMVRGYGLPLVLSLLFHMILGLLLFYSWPQSSEKRFVAPAHIKAALVELPTVKKSEPVRRPAVDKRAEQAKALADKKRRDDERRRREALEKEALEKEALEKEALKKEALKKEEQRKKALAIKREKEKKDKAKRDKARKDELARREKEKLRKKELEDKQRKRQDELLLSLEREQKAREAAEVAEQDQIEVTKYSSLIRSLVSQYWNRPPSARNGMKAEVRISLSPFGDILDIAVVKSSGSEEFDRSVIQAIKRSAPYSELKNLDRRIFNEEFRRFTFEFSPEDLVR